MAQRIEDKLVEKAKEAFIVAIELYNKPTIRYRVEGFSFFICNAWELMLKAWLIKKEGENSIYYSDNPDRTISLENCIRKAFTNDKDPKRRNLEKIIELRNTSTHFITEEYEMVYIPLFQANVLNFTEKMMEFHQVDLTKIIPQNFLTLTVSMKALDEEKIRAKYPEEIAAKIIKSQRELEPMIDQNNSGFAIKIEHYHYLTKDKNEATSFVKIDKNAETPVKIIKQIQDVNNTHPYTGKKMYKEIVRQIEKQKIPFCYSKEFNQYVFGLFDKVYGIRTNPELCYVHRQYAQPTYTYSQKAIDFILGEIKKDPENIIQNLKASIEKRQNKN